IANFASNTVSKVAAKGVASTVASGFHSPSGLAFDGAGNLYVANFSNNTVSRVTLPAIDDLAGNTVTNLPYTTGATFTYDPNDAPADITLSSNSIGQSGGTDAIIGALSTTDADLGDVHAYSLVSGSGGADNAFFNISGSSLRANNAALLAAGSYSIRIQTDDGNGGTYQKVFTVLVVDDIAPTVVGVTSSAANAAYKSGDVINIQISFSEPVVVTGTPQLGLETGVTDQTIDYVSGSGSDTLTFRYTVQSGDSTADLDYASTSALTLNGGTIQDAAANGAALSLASPGAAGSLAASKALVIDTSEPSISIGAPSIALTAGGPVNYTVTYSDANFSASTLAVGDITLNKTGTADASLAVTGSGNTRTVSLSTITGDGSLGITISPGTATDTAGNSAPGSGASSTFTVDNMAPTVVSITGVTNGTYVAGDVLNFTVNFSETITITGTDSILGLTLGSAARSATYLAGTATNITYTYTVQNGDSAPIGIVVGVIASGTSTITDLAGNAASLAQAGSADFYRATLVSSGLSLPFGLAIQTGSNNLVVADANNNSIKILSPTGTLITSMGSGILNTPYGFAQDSSGHFIVADTLNNRIVEFDSGGAYLGPIAASGLSEPFGVALDEGGNLLIADHGNDRVVKLQRDGTFISNIGSGLSHPTSVLLDRVGNIVVSDSDNGRIQVYRSDGTFLRTIGSGFLSHPVGLAQDAAGNFVEADFGSSSIKIFTESGLFQRSFNITGAVPNSVGGAVVDSSGNIIISSSVDNEIQVWGRLFPVTAFVDPAPISGGVSVPANGSYTVSQNLDFTVNFNEAVTVDITGGSPAIPLTLGTSTVDATYLSGSGTTALVFRYIIQNGDNDADGIESAAAIVLHGGTIKDSVGNDAPVTFSPADTSGVLVDTTAPSDISLSASSVAESQSSGSVVGILSAIDADSGNTGAFTLVSGAGDTDNASFTISGTSLKTAAVFDYEYKNSYSIRVRVMDSVGFTFEKSFTIAIDNINESPIFNGYSFGTAKNTAATVFRAKILARTTDPEGSSRNITAVDATSLHGGSVVLQTASITYTPPTDYVGSDSFQVTISDGVNSISGIVNVTVGSGPSGNGATVISITALGNDVLLKFGGIPGAHYLVQRSGTLADPVAWDTLTTIAANGSGFVLYTDPSPPSPSYWRTIMAP
ncbi:MAG: S-layer domain protein, partial [Verrucomicrobiales bacterium]|nr:S-layer domain protein [Verrucomicrobiales bacterium]